MLSEDPSVTSKVQHFFRQELSYMPTPAGQEFAGSARGVQTILPKEDVRAAS